MRTYFGIYDLSVGTLSLYLCGKIKRYCSHDILREMGGGPSGFFCGKMDQQTQLNSSTIPRGAELISRSRWLSETVWTKRAESIGLWILWLELRYQEETEGVASLSECSDIEWSMCTAGQHCHRGACTFMWWTKESRQTTVAVLFGHVGQARNDRDRAIDTVVRVID